MAVAMMGMKYGVCSICLVEGQQPQDVGVSAPFRRVAHAGDNQEAVTGQLEIPPQAGGHSSWSSDTGASARKRREVKREFQERQFLIPDCQGGGGGGQSLQQLTYSSL